ncbi:polymeric immunoglobulin receptor-like [Stegastes partitus]|uniref:polymeric immunoglobulin receptor-like n=1 Tax=Stegastes partitus TaxID=144197 RepID=UPI00049797AB|nr:PREDICTED: polymeric immunoglobulin receptor-like [Stegastes partitus]
MTSLYIPHLILAGLMGIHCRITTVSDVPVKAGESVSIPCLYEAQYRDDVKYLCKGYRWAFCKTVIRTDQEPCSGRFCISDDKEQRIFTVTIKNITDEDSYFWCAVEISGPDVKKYFQLSLTTGTPSLFVSQKEIAGPQGGSVTVLCHYNYPKVPQWCRLGSSCATDEIGSIDGTTVKINASVPDVLNVSMIELRTESSGWYWCAEGGFQMPVHVTVHELSSTTTTSSRPISTGTPSFTRQTSFSLTGSETHTAQPATSTRNGTGSGSPKDERKSFTMIIVLTTALVSLVLVVSAACFKWRMIVRKKSKPEVSDISVVSQNPDTDVSYATIVRNEHAGAETKDCIPTESVTYSTVVRTSNMQQMTEPADRSVIYSTIQYHEPQ